MSETTLNQTIATLAASADAEAIRVAIDYLRKALPAKERKETTAADLARMTPAALARKAAGLLTPVARALVAALASKPKTAAKAIDKARKMLAPFADVGADFKTAADLAGRIKTDVESFDIYAKQCAAGVQNAVNNGFKKLARVLAGDDASEIFKARAALAEAVVSAEKAA